MALSKADLALRRTGISGTDVAAILGLNRYRRPIDVYLDKIGEGEPVEESEPMRFGNLLEPVVAQVYQERHQDWTLTEPTATLRHLDRPWQLGTPDRIVFHAAAPADAMRILEIKCRGHRAAEGYGPEGTDEIPYGDLCQVTWYMSLCGLAEADLALLSDTNQYQEFHVELDEELEKYLLDAAEDFWNRVQRREPPDPDGSDQFKNYLVKRWPQHTEEVAVTSPELELVVAKYRLCKAIERECKAQEAGLKQIIQGAMGDAGALETAMGKLTWRTDKRGKVRWQAVAEALWAARLGVQQETLGGFADDFRGAAPRVLRTPRAWSKDPNPIETLTNGDDNEPKQIEGQADDDGHAGSHTDA